jgi:competence ComEA-like helix-hairpin-helix protein
VAPSDKPTALQPPPERRSALWLRRGDQIFVATLLTAGLVLLAIHWIRLSDWGRQTVEVDRLPPGEYQYSVDINQATWVEWAQFDGIGETLARRIVSDRDTHGPFTGIDDVLRVKGIGPKKLEQIRRYLAIDPAQATAARSARPTRKGQRAN